MELLVVQNCREDADSNKKDHQDQTKNAKVMRFQNLPNFAEIFIQFLGYAVCWGENYGVEKKVYKKKKFSGKYFGGKFFYFSKISLGVI